jgi:hypothetical protein
VCEGGVSIKRGMGMFQRGEKGGIILARQDFDRVVRNTEFNDKTIQFDQHYTNKRNPIYPPLCYRYSKALAKYFIYVN